MTDQQQDPKDVSSPQNGEVDAGEERTPVEPPAEESQATADGTDTATATELMEHGPALEQPAARPYLQVFGPDTGVFEFYLPYGSITIGRSDHADIWLPHHTVSRVHATIALDNNQYVLEDANSNFGTMVNNKRVDSHVLRHGDSIQISLYVLQFRTHPALPGASAAAARARMLLRTKFCLLPSTMRLKYRTIEVAPREIFRAGDTLKIGHGGLLIPSPTEPPKEVCLELQLFWPNQQSKRYLGEILGVIDEEGIHWLCVKLHSVPREIHEVVVAAARASEWLEVPAT